MGRGVPAAAGGVVSGRWRVDREGPPYPPAYGVGGQGSVDLIRLSLGLFVNVLLAVAVVRVGAGTLTAAIWGALAGLSIFVGFDMDGMLMLMAYVGIAFLATRFRRDEKRLIAGPDGRSWGRLLACQFIHLQPGKPAPHAPGDDSRRTGRQVFANLGVAAACALCTWRFGCLPLTVGFLCALGTSLADTLSSELGQIYGLRPRMITTFRVAARGRDGAVSWQGLVDGAAGAAILAVLAVPVMRLPFNCVWVIILASVIGDLSDSVIGALMPGRAPIENELTNFAATAVGAAVGGGIAMFLP